MSVPTRQSVAMISGGTPGCRRSQGLQASKHLSKVFSCYVWEVPSNGTYWFKEVPAKLCLRRVVVSRRAGAVRKISAPSGPVDKEPWDHLGTFWKH